MGMRMSRWSVPDKSACPSSNFFCCISTAPVAYAFEGTSRHTSRQEYIQGRHRIEAAVVVKRP